MEKSARELGVTIIGIGPRGLSLLERICANAHLSDRPIVVTVVDPGEPGPGGVWRSDQKEHLLMNTVASQATVFTDGSVSLEGPVLPGPSLYEWARSVAADPEYDDELRAVAGALGPDDYPTRAFYGQYLGWVYSRIVADAGDGVRILHRRGQATSIVDGENGRQTVSVEGSAEPVVSDAVVISMGHFEVQPTETEQRITRYAEDRGLVYVTPGNPADASLEEIGPGEPVVMRGMGLNFFDHMALLTEGRGGTFETVDDEGRLVYHPSGREPVLYAGSRRGVPYHARGRNEKGPYGRHEPLFVTPPVIERFRQLADVGRPANFRAHVWPLVAKEVETAYYRAELAGRWCSCVADRFVAQYKDYPWGGPGEHGVLEEFGIAEEKWWSWEAIDRPFPDSALGSPEQFRDWMLTYLEQDRVEADRGNVSGPTKAALDVLRDLRNEVRLVVDHGGIDGESYRDDVQGWYTPLNAYLSIGPPKSRIDEMLALVEAGIVVPLGPGMRVQCPDGDDGFQVTSEVAGVTMRSRALVEARLPEIDVRRADSPLLRSLVRSGRGRAYEIPTVDGGTYETGGLAVTDRPYRLIDGDGYAHPHRYAIGVPTEGVHWVTAAGIRPGVNSVTLTDADAVARTVLTETDVDTAAEIDAEDALQAAA